MPVPSLDVSITRAVTLCALESAEVSVTPLPTSCTGIAARVRAGERSVERDAGPAAPAVPTAVISRYSTLSNPTSTATFSPTTMFVTEATLMFVSPAAAAAASVVAVRWAVPIAEMRRRVDGPEVDADVVADREAGDAGDVDLRVAGRRRSRERRVRRGGADRATVGFSVFDLVEGDRRPTPAGSPWT